MVGKEELLFISIVRLLSNENFDIDYFLNKLKSHPNSLSDLYNCFTIYIINRGHIQL